MRRWNIYYRGTLSSCNYSCEYCPFAKTQNTRSELLQDQKEVERFVDWVEAVGYPISILFTPWGEALGHRYYRNALVRLSHFAHVDRVSIQTNLSASVHDLTSACSKTLALWATYHPEQVALDRFVDHCRQLERAGLRYSVGVVGLKEHFPALEQLRAALDPAVYVWVNAYKRSEDYYQPGDLRRIRAVDPYFDWNNKRYPSLGMPCLAGETHFTVDGAGDVRRCHFVGDVLTNLYQADVSQHLGPSDCPVATCGCYIGYIHRPQLALEQIYGEDLLARIPVDWPHIKAVKESSISVSSPSSWSQ